MAANRFFLSYDEQAEAFYIVPEMYREHWERWLNRTEGSSSENSTVYARRLTCLEEVNFADPKFYKNGKWI